MINILIDRSGKTSKENIFLGNQHENLDETLHFSFPKEYDNFYKYITYSYTNNGCRITGISPLVDDNFIVTSKITKCAGVWELNLICKISPVNLDDKVIDLTENNSTKEHIFISNTISACVSGNSIDVEAFNNVAVDENIASLYDSILALKNRVEENDKLHEQSEAIRKANELERQEAETTRKANESKRVSAEQLRVEAENVRKADETKRQSNESARIEAETNRDTAESERVNAENQRAEAENARQSAETNRASAENRRASAEANRDNVENERVNAETSRKQAESARVSAETARTQAEANRVETEKVRVSAENAREQAEQSRVNAESQRVTSEATRESAERARVEAESAREQAEQSRVNAENLRVEAENKREGTINDLKEQVDSKITKFYATNSGDTHLVDADNGKIMDMMIYGKAEQFKTTGKNYFDFSKIPTSDKMDTDGGTVVVDYSKQTLTIPSKTYYANTKKTLKDLCPNITTGTYTISMNRSNTESVDYIFILNGVGKVKLNTPVEISNEDLNCYVVFYNSTDSNVENVISNIQIEQGSSATAYEPYTGAKPSPSPEYPQDIKSVVNPTMKICGANLLKLDFATTKAKGIEIEVVGNKIRFHGTFTDTITYFDLKDKFLIKKGTQVSLYTDDNSEHDVFVWLKRIGSDEAQTLSKNQWSTITTNMDRTLSTIGIRGYNVGDTIDITITIAVLEGTNKYEPYKEQTLTLPITLNAVPVTTGGNVTIGGQQYVADYVDVERGKLVRMTKRVNMNDVSPLINLLYGQHSNGIGYLVYSIDEASNEMAMKDVEPLSNAYIGSKWTNKSGYVYIPNVGSIIFVDDRFTDKDTAINLFKDVYVIYVMTTPTEEDLTTEQINALKALKTYYPTTNIKVTSSQLDGYTVFDYPISMANGWNYVKQQLNDTRDYIYDIDVQSAEAYVNSEYVIALTELGV